MSLSSIRSAVLACAAFAVISFGPAAALAESDGLEFNPAEFRTASRDLYDCIASTVKICGVEAPVPAEHRGFQAFLVVPSPYVHEHFTAECVMNGNTGTYQITDESSVTCTKNVCAASAVEACGNSIAVPSGTAVGESIEVAVPSPTNPAPTRGSPKIKVECGDNSPSLPTYHVVDELGLQCSDFPCPAATLDVCHSPVVVPAGAAMGETKDMTMPAPFAPDHFTVQCHGTNGTGPVYEVTDSSKLSCKKATQ
jgi:hypothetical protein